MRRPAGPGHPAGVLGSPRRSAMRRIVLSRNSPPPTGPGCAGCWRRSTARGSALGSGLGPGAGGGDPAGLGLGRGPGAGPRDPRRPVRDGEEDCGRRYLEVMALDPAQRELTWFRSLPGLREPRLVGRAAAASRLAEPRRAAPHDRPARRGRCLPCQSRPAWAGWALARDRQGCWEGAP